MQRPISPFYDIGLELIQSRDLEFLLGLLVSKTAKTMKRTCHH